MKPSLFDMILVGSICFGWVYVLFAFFIVAFYPLSSTFFPSIVLSLITTIPIFKLTMDQKEWIYTRIQHNPSDFLFFRDSDHSFQYDSRKI